MMADNEDVSEPMTAAVMVLAQVAERDWPRQVRLPDATDYVVPDYDRRR
jgi:aminoglycoside/choline kinase family phosphotransferase